MKKVQSEGDPFGSAGPKPENKALSSSEMELFCSELYATLTEHLNKSLNEIFNPPPKEPAAPSLPMLIDQGDAIGVLGALGGVEPAFMSTTLTREVAMGYAAGTGTKTLVCGQCGANHSAPPTASAGARCAGRGAAFVRVTVQLARVQPLLSDGARN